MPDVQVRPFRRGDRDQLTRLVNAHAEAVVPGMSVSVNTVLGSLERQPGEFIVDPWVSERVTLVAEQRSRVAAAAHLLRYYPDDRAGPAYRDAGEIRWLLYWPLAPAGNPFWPNVTGAAEALIAACADVFGRWGVTRRYAGGDLPSPGRPPLDGLAVSRSVGINGCRLSAVLGEEVIGYIETEILDRGERLSRRGGWADVGNLHVAAGYRRRGVGSWLLGQAADWLRLAQVTRLLDYAWLKGSDPTGQSYDDYLAFLPAMGFRELTRTARGWSRE